MLKNIVKDRIFACLGTPKTTWQWEEQSLANLCSRWGRPLPRSGVNTYTVGVRFTFIERNMKTASNMTAPRKKYLFFKSFAVLVWNLFWNSLSRISSGIGIVAASSSTTDWVDTIATCQWDRQSCVLWRAMNLLTACFSNTQLLVPLFPGWGVRYWHPSRDASSNGGFGSPSRRQSPWIISWQESTKNDV